MAVPRLVALKQVWLVRPPKGSAERVPFSVAEPWPVASVLKLAELTAAHCPAPVQAQLAAGSVDPLVIVATGGSPEMAHGLMVALP